MDLLSPRGSSTAVELKLLVQGEVVDVLQTGPNSLILRESRELPKGPAELVVTLDGDEHKYEIILSSGDGPEIFYW